jgi:CBS-domain-containing membrane protein
MTRVEDIMSKEVFSCHMEDSLNTAAQIMWEHDCGCVPIVDGLGCVLGIVTDRDVCMAAYTKGARLADIPVSSTCTRELRTCKTDEPLSHAEETMTRAQVRRLPVTDADGHLVGMLSLSDLAQHLRLVSLGKSNPLGPRDLSNLMEAVSRPRETWQHKHAPSA